LRAALEKLVQTSLTAYHESEAAIAAASHHLTADMHTHIRSIEITG